MNAYKIYQFYKYDSQSDTTVILSGNYVKNRFTDDQINAMTAGKKYRVWKKAFPQHYIKFFAKVKDIQERNFCVLPSSVYKYEVASDKDPRKKFKVVPYPDFED